MAQWSHAEKTLVTKLVYYGPARGGKTTNLHRLHEITDPTRRVKLLSLDTSDDRTLFFDLLPFDLGSVLGYRVAVKLFTVPGQVRYDATRRVVLAGADAVVFVADSSRDREQENRASLENLRSNMKANHLSPDTVPVVFQFNKQDLPNASTPAEIVRWLGLEASDGIVAVATEGEGVLDTFVAAAKAMLRRLTAFAEITTRGHVDLDALERQIDAAFAPHRSRAGRRPAPVAWADRIVCSGEDLLERAVDVGVRLGDELAIARARCDRFEREAEGLRRLSDAVRSVGAVLHRGRVVEAALDVSRRVLGDRAVSLIGRSDGGAVALEATTEPAGDPLLDGEGTGSLVDRLVDVDSPVVVDDLSGELGSAHPLCDRFRAVLSVPVDTEARLALIAYAPRPDGEFLPDDVRFLATVAGHLATGLAAAAIHAELADRRNELEVAVRDRTRRLRQAYDELRRLDRTKDRFLSGLSHEMRTPLTAIVGAAAFLRDYEGSAEQRAEMATSIIHSARTLDRFVDHVLRVSRLADADRAVLKASEVDPRDLAGEAVRLAGADNVTIRLQDPPPTVRVDAGRLSRALANLIDNARKFSPAGSGIDVVVARVDPSTVGWAVLDRGPGMAPGDLARLFRPFEQGGDPLTGKPPGIGLGLHEVALVARLHGGRVRYAARRGGGSVVRIDVPREAIGAPVAQEQREAVDA